MSFLANMLYTEQQLWKAFKVAAGKNQLLIVSGNHINHISSLNNIGQFDNNAVQNIHKHQHSIFDAMQTLTYETCIGDAKFIYLRLDYFIVLNFDL